jgi:hypothetical protein
MLKVIPISSLLAVLFVSNCLVVTQAQTQVRENGDLAAKQLEQVQIEAQSIGSFFSKLALSFNIPIGLEIAAKQGDLASYGTDFKKGTLSELLNQFVIQHNEYAWEIRDGVVNVFPKDDYRDALFHNLLEIRIGRFTVKENTSCWTLAETLLSTPEMKRVLEANGTTYRAPDFSGFYIPQAGRHFTLDVSNVTLRSILNRIVEQSPTSKFWIIARNYDGSFFISFGARHEDSPKGNGDRINLRE